jgi:exodeoxyribonuclease VII small subunit
MTKSAPNSTAHDFEKSLARLETIVAGMEDNSQSLEQSLSAFEEGIKLTREAQKALVEAEQKVQLLLQDGEEIVTADFPEDEPPE